MKKLKTKLNFIRFYIYFVFLIYPCLKCNSFFSEPSKSGVNSHLEGKNSKLRKFKDENFHKVYGSIGHVILGVFIGLSSIHSQVQAAVGAPSSTFDVLQCASSQCSQELLSCLQKPRCFAGSLCISTCRNRIDEADCQMNCLNYFEDNAMRTFSSCLFDQLCIEKRADDGRYPALQANQYVDNFDMEVLKGEWFVAAGLNPLFEGFACQKHTFLGLTKEGPSKSMVGAMTYRITEPFGNFFTRAHMRRFEQNNETPGVIYNFYDYMNMVDAWYVLDFKADEYILIYYRGDSDAWVGYGGATLYTRSGTIPTDSEDLKNIEAACTKAGIPFHSFFAVDNTCSGKDTVQLD